MGAFAPLGLGNAILPLAGLLFLVVGLPFVLIEARTLSQARLAQGIVATAALVLLAGAGMMAAVYAAINAEAAALWRADPVGRALFFLGRSAMMGLMWAPLLALVWLVRAQGVERRRGLLMHDEEAGR